MIDEQEGEGLRAAWRRHSDAVQEIVDEAIDGKLGDARDGAELAELLRSIGRIEALCLQQRLDFNDPDFPQFLRQMDDRFKYGGPDVNIAYFFTSLRGDAQYRVRGNNQGRALNVGGIWGDYIETDADGTFEVQVSAEKASGNWSPIPADLDGSTFIPEDYPVPGHGLHVRRYDWDWDQELPPGWLTIERCDAGAPAYPEPLTAARLAHQVDNATRIFVAAARWWNQRAADIRAALPVNTITPPSTQPPATKNFVPPQTEGRGWIHYGHLCHDLAEDEAILIETDIPDGPYWSFTLYNAWWETPDLMNRQTALNHNQVFLDEDGKARVVISRRDPGVPNWLDTGGAARGFLHYRWWRPDQKLPVPVATLLKVDDLRARLAVQHPVIDAATRRATLSKRREQLARRFQR